MDAPLFICTKEEQRAVILFLWAESVPCVRKLRKMSVQYRNSALSQWFVYKWIEWFKNGRTSINHEEETGCPSTSITGANTEIHDMILQNRQVTNYEVAH